MENNQQPMLIGDLPESARAEFYRKTYSHVAGGILAFIIVEYFFLQSDALIEFTISMLDGYKWFIMLGGFMLITNYTERMTLRAPDIKTQYLAYGLHIVAEAFIFVPLLYIAIAYTEGYNLLYQASIVTLSLFTGLSAIVFFTKKDFSFLRSILTIGFFIALGLIVAGIFFGFDLGLWFSVGMCVLASGSILYQTSNIVHKYSEDQYIPAALGLFASLMLLFWYVIQIFLSRD